ncbi:hypothetical protein N7449_001246 [Penicillium cf. viridicatum]|uniref:Uncharacterized protein n=1 Tax=Penicillium cf. viridicatum TaxID=2972119 RepID=A0A9W9N6B6_9EURO|nr:hypothetical protein N7449_001246 [Penicillium cf. viridicatum]
MGGDTEIPSNLGDSQCASKRGADWRPWALRIGLDGGPMGDTADPTGQVDGTLTVNAKTFGGPHGK